MIVEHYDGKFDWIRKNKLDHVKIYDYVWKKLFFFFFFFEFLLMASSLDDCSLTLDQDVN